MHDNDIEKDKVKGIAVLVVGFLMAVMGFLATLNIEFEWLTKESINAFGVVFTSGAVLIGGAIATWKNKYVGEKARKQNEQLYKSKQK